jgi:uncharacterized phage protein (TIGR02220 family)
MKKLTKRKAFNFLRSYFDVFNELDNDTDRLNFLTSILNKQFLNEDPKELNFIVNLCYESQRHAIESSVKGWERANKTTLGINPLTTPPTPLGTNPPNPLVTDPKEEKEEEQEKGEYTHNPPKGEFNFDYEKFLHFINKTLGRKLKVIKKSDKTKIQARLKEGYTKSNFQNAVENCKHAKVHVESNYKHCTMEFFARPKTLDQYGEKVNKKSNMLGATTEYYQHD